MKTILTYAVIMVVVTIIIGITGFIMRRGGKPYAPLFFNVHKFMALGFILVTVLSVMHYQKAFPLSVLLIALLIFEGLFALALFATGGILSHQQTINKSLVLVHKISSFLMIITTTALMWVFIKPA